MTKYKVVSKIEVEVEVTDIDNLKEICYGAIADEFAKCVFSPTTKSTDDFITITKISEK